MCISQTSKEVIKKCDKCLKVRFDDLNFFFLFSFLLYPKSFAKEGWEISNMPELYGATFFIVWCGL